MDMNFNGKLQRNFTLVMSLLELLCFTPSLSGNYFIPALRPFKWNTHQLTNLFIPFFLKALSLNSDVLCGVWPKTIDNESTLSKRMSNGIHARPKMDALRLFSSLNSLPVTSRPSLHFLRHSPPLLTGDGGTCLPGSGEFRWASSEIKWGPLLVNILTNRISLWY